MLKSILDFLGVIFKPLLTFISGLLIHREGKQEGKAEVITEAQEKQLELFEKNEKIEDTNAAKSDAAIFNELRSGSTRSNSRSSS